MADRIIPLLAWACSPNATLQKQFAITICRLLRAIIDCGNNGPDLGGVSGGWGEIGAVLCLGGQRGPDCIGNTASAK